MKYLPSVKWKCPLLYPPLTAWADVLGSEVSGNSEPADMSVEYLEASEASELIVWRTSLGTKLENNNTLVYISACLMPEEEFRTVYFLFIILKKLYSSLIFFNLATSVVCAHISTCWPILTIFLVGS
jgi:hypothetical protein